MNMNCPVCKTSALSDVVLDDGLLGHGCPSCAGRWINGGDYLRWVEVRGPQQHPPANNVVGSSPAPATDHREAKLCPECGRFLGRAPTGHGATFHLDRCGNCGGIWLDAGEWDALRSAALHDRIHFIFSPAWQADVTQQERAARHERLLIQRIGERDGAELKRIRAWLDAHPHRAELYAALLQGNAVRP
jgi:Zn-finger nucleic acid-binding protein